MSFSDKIEVVVRDMPKYNKRWAEVRFNYGDNRWIPSFQDLFRIIQAICHCEDEKYPNGKGRQMVREFLWDACEAPDHEHTLNELWMGLQAEYKIPDRDK